MKEAFELSCSYGQEAVSVGFHTNAANFLGKWKHDSEGGAKNHGKQLPSN